MKPCHYYLYHLQRFMYFSKQLKKFIYMKKLLFIALISIFISCSQGLHPDFAANVETVKKQLELQGSEADHQAQLDMAHEDIQWQPAFYGSTEVGKEEYGAYLKGWQDEMEDVVFTPRNGYLPGVLAETGVQDGSVRVYGTWAGVHSATGKSWELNSYHTWDFKEGLIISGGDYFDASGFIASLEVEEPVVEE